MLESILPPDRSQRLALLVGVVAMAVVVTGANIAVLFPINDWLTWGHFVFPFAFFVTDAFNRLFGAAAARRMVFGGFAVAVIASALLSEPRIALASGTAYLVGQLLDVAVFDRLRHRPWWQAPAISSGLASVVDTALFYGLAFAGTGLPWVTWGATDLAVKLLMVGPLLVPFRIMVLAVRDRVRMG